MSHSPADNCFNATAIHYRSTPGVKDNRGGTTNAAPYRVREDLEPVEGFRCGLYADETADENLGGGPSNVDHWVFYCLPRDIRQEDSIQSPLHPGRKMIVTRVKRHGGSQQTGRRAGSGIGQITPFVMAWMSSPRDQSIVTIPSPS